MKHAVLFKVMILLCTGLLEGGYCYCPRCEAKNTNNNTCTFWVPMYDIPSCDCSNSNSECEHHSTAKNDSFQPIASSFQVTVNYTSRTDASVIVSWMLPDGDHPSSTTFNLKISYYFLTEAVCLTLASTITKVEAQLIFPPKPCRAHPVDNISVTLTARGEYCGQIHHTLPVYDCFKTMGNQSDDICGLSMMVPPAPTSAEATVIKQPPGKTVVQVSWEPDKDGVVPVSYNLDLTLLSNLGYSLFLNVPGNSTEHIVTINQTLSPSNGAYFKVRSGGYVDGPDCNCLSWPLPPLQQTVFFCHGTNATLQFPGQPLNVHLVIWPVLAGTVAVVMVILLIIYGIRRLRRWVKTSDTPYDVMSPPDVHEQGTVFLAASTEEDERMKRRIRHLCHILGEHGLTPVYYEYVVNDHSANSPSALGMNHWVELQLSRCEFVLFVCTKRFLEEWNGKRSDIPSPLVYPCRNMLDGSLQRPQSISRYAVLFMGDGHSVPRILGCFRQFDIFQVGSEDIHADSLIHYLLEVPSFVPPRVVNFFRQFV